MKNTNAFGASVPFAITKMMVFVGRGILMGTKALTGAFLGILTAVLLVQFWNALNWSELQTTLLLTQHQAALLLADSNVLTSIVIISGGLTGVGCEVFLTRRPSSRTSTSQDQSTIEFLQKLGYGDTDSKAGQKQQN
jgi:hypothetical protein